MKTMIKFRPKQQVEIFAEEVANEVVDRLKRTVNVKNLNHGTDENTNYIRQWETYKGHKATQCANHDCRNEKKNPALVGAHVIKSESEDKSWYICPLCSKCNSDDNYDDMVVNEIDLAPYKEIKDL